MVMLAIPNVAKADADKFLHVLTLVKASQKFLLPVNGRLLHDMELRALDDTDELRLPYPIIALEYELQTPFEENDSKDVVFAMEDEDGVIVRRVGFNKANGAWGIGEACKLPRTGYLAETVNGVRQIVFHPILWPTRRPDDSIDLQGASTLLCFLNALACSNVHVERSEPKKAGQKIKSALPFDSYHVLTIDISGSAGIGPSTGGHRSPREHLRRGHIRRLVDGRRIWVNAAVVGAGRVGGVVTKDYRVTHDRPTSSTSRAATDVSGRRA